MAEFRKSSFSQTECVEVAPLPSGGVAVRNSKDPSGLLAFTAGEWIAFIKGVRAGEFDLCTGCLKFRVIDEFDGDAQWCCGCLDAAEPAEELLDGEAS